MLNNKSANDPINKVLEVIENMQHHRSRFKQQLEDEVLLEEAINESINSTLLAYLKSALEANSPSVKQHFTEKFTTRLMNDVREYINQ